MRRDDSNFSKLDRIDFEVNSPYTWVMEKSDDPSMTRVRAWVESSNFTLQEIGVLMGFSEATSRQSVYQFLKGNDPRISTLRRFAKATGISIEELVSENQTKTKRK